MKVSEVNFTKETLYTQKLYSLIHSFIQPTNLQYLLWDLAEGW